MNNFRTRALLFCLITLSFANAQSYFPKVVEENFDAFVTERLTKENLPGLQTVVVKDGQVIFTRALGLADVENNILMTVDTPMPVGTLSRAFTVIAIMQLVEQGKLNLDGTLAEYLPWVKLPDDGQHTLTVQDLLGPEGIIVDLETELDLECSPDCALMIGSETTSKEAYIESLMPDTLDLTSAGNSRNLAFWSAVLLGLILEKVTGMTFEDYMQANVFAPMQLNATYDLELAKQNGLAMGYKASSVESLEARPYVAHSVLNPYMGLIMNSQEVAKFLFALLARDPDILSTETWEMLLSQTGEAQLFAALVSDEIPTFEHKDLALISNLDNRHLVFNILYEEKLAFFTMGNWQSGTFERNLAIADMPMVAATNLFRYEDKAYTTSPFAVESLENPSVENMEKVTGSYASAAGPVELFAVGEELRGTIVGQEFKLEHIEGDTYLSRSDYKPIDGIEMFLYGDRIEVSLFWQLAFRVKE